ncbi:MAG TPA: S8 family serine peptidase, partial [Pontiella sp.]|nr:S8 family serine peptidase [Pontiella sp.]
TDIAEMISRAASYPGEPGKIYLSNHSYGTVGGWTWGLGGSAYYYWPSWLDWGPGEVDTFFGQYDAGAISYDQVVYDAPYFLPFVSVGNDRSDNPLNGETVVWGEIKGNKIILWHSVTYNDSQHPLGDGVYKSGYDNISAEATAKNIMTVGAVYDAVSGNARMVANAAMSSFSSWGPADDGRIKPDIVANGIGLYSCWNDYNNLGDYYTLSGTSMASPNACGSATLLVDYYDQRFPGGAMRASTLKGLIIHTADDRGNPGPDYSYGWGLMNTAAAAQLIKDYADGNMLRMTEAVLSATNSMDQYSYTSDGLDPIRATLCWTDPPGPLQTTHDSRTPALVNDLDLKIVGPGGTNYPYRLDYNSPASNATMSAENDVDNVEQVYISAPAVGTYTIVVDYDGVLQDGEQTYSLLISGLSTNAVPENPDLDGDGLPNFWEVAYFADPTSAVASADSDGDGENNLSEYISGHVPTNPASYFSITNMGVTSTNEFSFILSWETVSGRVYGVNWTDILTNSFTNISGDLPYPAGSYTDTVERIGPQHFYRIDVRLSP